MKILGGIDLVSAIAFLMIIFGVKVFPVFFIFCIVLLFIKSLFIFTGDFLSFIDLISGLMLLISLFLNLPIFLLWLFTFLLIGKGLFSFV